MRKCSLLFELKRSLKVRAAMRVQSDSGCCVVRRSVDPQIGKTPPEFSTNDKYFIS